MTGDHATTPGDTAASGGPTATPAALSLPVSTAEPAVPARAAEPPSLVRATEPPPPIGATEPAPPIGTPVRDTARDRVGVVSGHQGRYIQLRPLDGGREWDADPVHVEPVGPIEVLRARVAEANHRSRRGPLG